MRSLYVCIGSIVALATSRMAHAQRTNVESPYITRSCLWNADKHTWRTLDLERAQVYRLAQLRQQFPAVVDGQWMDPGDEERPRSTAWPGGPVVLTSYDGGLATSTVPTGRKSGPPFSALQTELRKVLSLEQLKEWERLCPGR